VQSKSHRNIATTPQPRKPNHVIIADAITTARMQIAAFLPLFAGDNPGMIEGFCNSTCCILGRISLIVVTAMRQAMSNRNAWHKQSQGKINVNELVKYH
jgi:hypothetical protein